MQAPYSCEICGITASDGKALDQHIQGKRHMKRLQVVQQQKKFEENGIYVSGFPPRCSPQALYEFFQSYGDVEQFTHRGRYALLSFKNRTTVQHCLTSRLCIQGRPLFIKQQKQRPTNFRQEHNDPKKKENNAGSADQHQLTVTISGESFDEQLSNLLEQIQLHDDGAYLRVCYELQMIFREVYRQCRTYPFGSTVTGLAFKGSDLDVYMDLGLGKSSMTEDEVNTIFNTAKKLLYRHGALYARVITIPKAKTPIIKFVHKPTNISCDLNFKNALGIRNTNLIKFYLSLDHRLKRLLTFIKFWTKKNDLTGSGKLSHYALVMLVFFFLQQLKKPIIPPVIKLQQSSPKHIIDNWNSGFNSNAYLYSANDNEDSIPELLRDFFKFCARFDYDANVICPLMGKPLTKTLFLTPDKLPAEQDGYKQFLKTVQNVHGLKTDTVMCIQDPFELRHNLTAGMGEKAMQIFKCYCECAATLCSEAIVNGDAKNSGFLKVLIGENMKPQLPIFDSNKVTVTINMGDCPIHPKGDAVSETEALRNDWYSTVFEVLLEILHKVLKLETGYEVSGEGSDKMKTLKGENSNKAEKHKAKGSNKVQKLEGQSDVGERMNSVLETKALVCSGHHSVWLKRKECTSKLVIPENLTTIEREQAISDLLIDDDENNGIRVSFFCLFEPKKTPTSVTIQILNKMMPRRDFRPMISFLKKVLHQWIEQSLKEKQTENLKLPKNLDNPDMH